MARQRRGGGGFRPPELRGTLGTLINTALQQAGVVRDALERGAREGRSRLDEVRSNRRRHDALAELGEIVLDLVRRGEIDLDELPEAQDVIRTLDQLDDEDHPDDAPPRPAVRRRFDERGRDDRDDEGTVSSKTWTPPTRRSGAKTSVWRPPVDAAPLAPDNGDEPAAPARTRPVMPPNPHKKGGIAFDDDDDLADYMHPDDVPAKPADGDS